MQQQLSSELTVWWKVVFPALWIAGFGAAPAALWFGAFRGGDNAPTPEWARWQFLIMWVVGSLWLVSFSLRLCRVGISEDALFASNSFHHIAVPLSAIVRVRQSYMSRPQTITIHLDRETPLGRKIVFIPRGWPHFLSRHPVTDQLRAIIGRFHPAPPVTDVTGTPWVTNQSHTFDQNDRSA